MAVHAFLQFQATVQRLAMGSPAGTARRLLRLLPISGFLLLPLFACSDGMDATAPVDFHPSFTQVASAPVVNSLADPGTGGCDDTECTLREAIAFASSGATITFAAGLSGTIPVGSSLSINKYLTIAGPGADQLAVSGGGLYLVFWITGGQSTISGLTIRDGLGWSNGGGGVVVSNSGTAATLENCVLTNNSAGSVYYQNGGAILVNAGTDVTISSCTFYGNSAPDGGQAVYQIGGSLTILNSTISGNSYATGKAAVVQYQGAMRIDHSTITANGGGVEVRSAATTGVSVKASIISGNASVDVSGASLGAFNSGGYNLIGTSGTNFDVLPAFAGTGDQTGVTDVNLGPLALNSPGTTLTHALLATSPAIDAGVCTDIDGNTVTMDQRGVTRPQGSACDIGAYEKETTPTALVVNSLADPGAGGCDETECTLREAIEASTPGSTISFSPDLTGTIDLIGELQLFWNMNINGPGPEYITVDANGTVDTNQRALVVYSTTSISGLTITGGYSSSGGGVWNDGTLTLSNMVVTGNVGSGDGGGIYNSGTLTISQSEVSNNTGTYGGGVANSGTLLVDHSTLSGNEASTSYGWGGVGGGIWVSPDAVTTTLSNSTISGNTAACRGGGIDNQKSIRIEYTTISANTATSSIVENGCMGGGLQSYTGEGEGAEIVGSIIWGNLAGGVAEDLADQSNNGTFNSLGHNLIGAAGYGVDFTYDFVSTGDQTGVSATEGVLDALALNTPGTTATHALPAGSPAIDAGTCTGLDDATVMDDQRGVTRPQGNACDIGAYEMEGGGGKATPSVTISNLPESGTVGSGFTPTVVADGDGVTSVTSSTLGICTVDGTTGYVGFIAVGTCTLVAHVAEGTNYVAADGAPQQVTVSSPVLLTPKFTFDLSRMKQPTFGDAPFSVAANRYVSTNSTGEITFAVGAGSAGCDVTAAGMVTITGAALGESYCVIEASLAPALPYEGAGPIRQSFHIAKAAATVSITNLPAAPDVGGGFTPEYNTASDGLTSVESATPAVCSVSGGDVSFVTAGTCTLVAQVAEGTNWLAAVGEPQSVQVGGGGTGGEFFSACTFSVNPKNGQSDITVEWANADPGVTSILITDGRDLTKQLAPTPTGSWTTRLKSVPTGYSLWGGDGRAESTVPLVQAGACVQTGQN